MLGRRGKWSRYFIACGKGKGLCNKVILKQRLKGARVCYIKFCGKYVSSRGKSKGIEVGVCSVGLENEH